MNGPILHGMASPFDNEIEFWEDFEPGAEHPMGSFTLTQDEIIEFATRFDPQPFHIDPAAAAESMYGGIIASGWHTTAATMRLMVDHLIPSEASLGSPGMDEIRWLKPVFPDVEYHATYCVNSVVASTSKPDRGIVNSTSRLFNPDGEEVMNMTGVGFYLRRPAAPN